MPSEDDPFGNIPDLTCDIEEETRRLFLAGDSTQRDQLSTEELLQRHREESLAVRSPGSIAGP